MTAWPTGSRRYSRLEVCATPSEFLPLEVTFLLLNQTFYPDVASTAQHLRDVALALAGQGHEVTVLASRRAYDDPEKVFPKQETWGGIRIIRVGSTGFGKGARWRRAADFASFLALCAVRLALLRRPDVVLAMTSPPLISFLAAWFTKLRRARFVYWVMDLNPDEALAAGWLAPGSLTARLLEGMSRFSLRRADRVIALDRFMRERIVAKGIDPAKIVVLPPWPQDTEVRFDPAGGKRFRKEQGLEGKFVVMYSGNHSPCHPLETLLEAARRLAGDSSLVFCFVGGGSEWRRIREQQLEHRLSLDPRAPGLDSLGDGGSTLNVLTLPYQPLAQLSASLSAADLQVVVMGDLFVGLVHPCKIYNILNIGAPVLYIGPERSPVTELAAAAGGRLTCYSARHGDVEAVVTAIRSARAARNAARFHPQPSTANHLSKQALLDELLRLLGATAAGRAGLHVSPARKGSVSGRGASPRRPQTGAFGESALPK